MRTLPGWLKAALKLGKKPLKIWLRDRALRLPNERAIEIARRLNVPHTVIIEVNTAIINDALNAVEREL